MLTKFNQSNRYGCMIQSQDSPQLVMSVFDRLPKDLRDRINYSPFKLCTLCVGEGQNITEMEMVIRSWDETPNF